MFGKLALEDHREKVESFQLTLMREASIDDLLPDIQLNSNAKAMGLNIDTDLDTEEKDDIVDSLETTVTNMLDNDEQEIAHMTDDQLDDYIEDLGVRLEAAFIKVENEGKSDPKW